MLFHDLDLPDAPCIDPERPRERIWRCGTNGLGDSELLAVLLGTGIRCHPVDAVARTLISTIGGLTALARASPREISQIVGIGSARAACIAAAFELGRRALDFASTRETLHGPADVAALLTPRLGGLAQEVFIAIGLDTRNRILDIVEVARGTATSVECHPREVFRPLIRMSATACVVVHNHPSGDPAPSDEDLDLTRTLYQIGLLLGIPVIDHIVIGSGDFRSILEWSHPEIREDYTR